MDFRTALIKVNANGVSDIANAITLADLLTQETAWARSDGFADGQSKARVINEPTHDTLVYAILGHTIILEFLADGKKVQAIKEVRGFSNASLKAAKEATLDQRVTKAVADLVNERVALSDPWGDHVNDEPPF